MTVTLILFIVLHCMFPPHSAAEGRTYIFMDEPVAPYTFGDEGGVCEGGLTKELFDEIFLRLGMRYEIRLVPWARAMDSVTNGECDGIPLLVKTTERESFLAFTDPVVKNRELLFYVPERLGDFQWDRLSDLKGMHLGLVRGYTYAKPFLDAVTEYGIRVTYAKDSAMIFGMLEAGRVDMVLEDESVTKPLMASHPEWAGTMVPAKKPISSYHWHIGLHRDSPLVKHIDAINRVLDAMRADGSLARILDKR